MAFFGGKHASLTKIRLFNQNEISVQTLIQRSFKLTATIFGSIVPFKLSDIGEGIREVAVKEWFVKTGDKVAQFDNICEVQSDKASVTITSRYDGIIKKIYYDVDQTAYVGQPLVDIEVEGEDCKIEEKIPTPAPIEEKVKNNTQINTQNETDEYSLCIPSVRRLARQYKIDLNNIKGSGKKQRILKEDVLKYLQNENTHEETVKLTNFQKAMFQTMTASLKIPHFTYTDEISMTDLIKLRTNLNKTEIKLSYVSFFIKALSLALIEYPILNSSLNNEEIIIKKSHNIGIAMDTSVGLAVPVIKNVQNLNVLKINKELERLMENGKKGNFSMDDLKDGTFTFSNIGAIGGLHASPIILAPQVAIIAIGAVKSIPKLKNNEIVSEDVVNMCGSADHRVIDGATMAKFVNCVKKYLENPQILLLK